MESSYTMQLVLLMVCLILSGFFSMSETALMSINRMKIRAMVDNKVKCAKLVEKMMVNPNKVLSAILIGNNIVNIAASSIATSLAIKFFNGSDIAIAMSTGVMTILVLIFGEITPKSLAKQKSEEVAIIVATPISFCVGMFKPFIFIFMAVSNFILKILGNQITDSNITITEEELKTMVGVSEEEGVLQEAEKEMIFNVFAFTDLQVKDVMVQRIAMKALNANESVEKIFDIIRQEQYSRFPVFEEDTDNIIGVLNVKDLIMVNKSVLEDINIRDYLRDVMFTFEFRKVSEVFKEMKQEHTYMKLVLDEYGNTVGLITMEDLVEEIVGEINDEYDLERESFKEISENCYIIDGSFKISDLNEKIGIDLETEDFDTVGGLILERTSKVPDVGYEMQIGNVCLNVKEIQKNRIKRIIVEVK